jgi:hypothetical protein
MNLDDALLWLSDRQGREVTATIEIERGTPFDEFEFRVTGRLRHDKEGQPPEIAARPHVVAGLYRIGDAVLSLANLAPIKVTTEPGNPNWLIVWIDEHTTFEIFEED